MSQQQSNRNDEANVCTHSSGSHFQIQLRSNGLKNDTLVIAKEMSYRHDPGPTLTPQVWLTQRWDATKINSLFNILNQGLRWTWAEVLFESSYIQKNLSLSVSNVDLA